MYKGFIQLIHMKKEGIRMIDKNGKLFGKISIIDIGIVLLLLIAALFIVYKLGVFSPKQVITGSTDKIRIVFYQEEVNSFTAENVKLKDPASDSMLNTSFGQVVDIEVADSVSWGKDKDGKQVRSTKTGWSAVSITMEAAGTIGSNGITIGGSRYYIGQLVTLKAGTSVFYGRITDASKV